MSTLVERCGNNKHFQEIYKMVQGKLGNVKYTADGVPTSPLSHTNDEIELIKREQFGQVTDNFITAYGADYKTYKDVCRSAAAFSDDALKRCIKDGFYNPISGTGTGVDPSLATQANIPLLIGPGEVTALYSNGGISQIIIDKKSKGVLLNGYRFKGTGFEEQQLIDLQGHAEMSGFGMALNDVFRDGNIYGGSVLFPIFNKDNPLTTAMTAKQLFQSGVLEKNCLRRWVEVDRWNTVVVPSFDLTEEGNIVDVLVNNKIASSKREAREFIKGNAISVNGNIINDETTLITKDMAIEGEIIIFRRGKKKYFIGNVK